VSATLWLVRPAQTAAGSEEEVLRPLSRKGRARVATAANALWRLDTRLDRIVHAPTTAGAESAGLLSALLGGDLCETARLLHTPEESLLAQLEGRQVGVVGHQPWLGELIAWLVVGQRTRGDFLKLGRGAVAVLRGRVEPEGMHLRGLWSNKALRTLS